MAKNRSKASTYPSRYSPGGWVTGVQFAIEIVCANKARMENKADLPIQFWKLPEWEKYFASQLRAANKLKKKYGVESIVAVAKNKYNLMSFRPKWVEELVAQEKIKIDKRKALEESSKKQDSKERQNLPDKPTHSTYRKKNSTISKLRDLE